uniref:Uncharacterized protein n=1 Tax=Arundo donax TaxID=35708 RepID=A0A0A9DKJ1_ARUDO
MKNSRRTCNLITLKVAFVDRLKVIHMEEPTSLIKGIRKFQIFLRAICCLMTTLKTMSLLPQDQMVAVLLIPHFFTRPTNPLNGDEEKLKKLSV